MSSDCSTPVRGGVPILLHPKWGGVFFSWGGAFWKFEFEFRIRNLNLKSEFEILNLESGPVARREDWKKAEGQSLDDLEIVALNNKKEIAQKELDFIKESLLRKHLAGTDSTQGALKTLEDGADTMEKESLSQLAGRQQKFINNLENALIRIKNGE